MSVVIENVHFLRAIVLPNDGKLEFLIALHGASGEFIVFESGQESCTGKVFIKNESVENLPSRTVQFDDDTVIIKKDDIYKEFLLRGFDFG